MNNYLWNGDCEYNEKGEMIYYDEEWKCEVCNLWVIKKVNLIKGSSPKTM